MDAIDDILRSLPKMEADRYGTVLIEDEQIPCCVAVDGMIYVPTQGVSGALKVPGDEELKRIMSVSTLAKGMAMVPFKVPGDIPGELVTRYFPAISITRLHAWLMLIPDSIVTDVETSKRLAAMQDRLADIIYAYLGRPLIPEEYAQTMERSFPAETREVIEAMQQVPGLAEELKVTKGQVNEVSGRLKVIEAALSLSSPTGQFIDNRQRQIYIALIGIVGKEYEKKHPGEFDEVEKRLKRQYDYVFYKVILTEQWEGVVRSLIATYKSLVPHGTTLPQIFEDALKLKTQPPLSKKQSELF